MTAIANIEDARRIVRELHRDGCKSAGSGVLTSSSSPFETCSPYVRTKRPRRDDTLASFIVAHDDWAAYLRERGFITQRLESQ